LRGIAFLGMVFRRAPASDRQPAAARECLRRDLTCISHIFPRHTYRDGVTLGKAQTTDDFPLNP
jgi:hypothetical protein